MTATEGAPTPEEIDAFMRGTVISLEMTDETASMLEDRIMDLEEIIYAGWPRSILLARRLRRRIKASISGFPGATFASRRVSAVSTEMATAQARRAGGRSGGAL
jgi:hypothetical protein